jgi:aspartyl-tRNA(Asn)/glutamyl-tRNA(Gln) amidotransferase subunit C
MANLNKEAIKLLTKLSNISCDEEDVEKLLKDLAEIIGYVEQLNEIQTENVEPCFSVLNGLTTPLREDNPDNSLSREDFLKNARHKASLVTVPSVITK